MRKGISLVASMTLLVSVLIGASSAYAATMNAGISVTDGFPTSWTSTHPDVTTTSSLSFKTNATNYYLDPSAASGDFYWNGTGTQPDYTMDPNASVLQYAGHIGGSGSTLDVGNLTFDPNGNGSNFLTWLVDVPSLGTTDAIHFDLTSEQVLSTTTSVNGTGTTKNLSLNLFGYASDALNHWTSSYSILNLTVSESISSTGNYTYSWAGTWSSPAGTPGPVPEPATIALFGLGMAFLMVSFVFGRRAGGGEPAA
jgi:hypothetical protein